MLLLLHESTFEQHEATSGSTFPWTAKLHQRLPALLLVQELWQF